MSIIRSALFLLMLDLLTKHAFRFYEQDLALDLVLIEGYLYVYDVTFNYGNGFASSDEDVGILTQAYIYSFFIVSMAGCVLGLSSIDEEDSKLTAVPYIFMIAGGLGNTLERIIYGNVCDWITLTRPVSEYLLVLNFADIFICISLLTLPFTMQELKLKLFFGAIFYVLAFSPLYGVMFG